MQNDGLRWQVLKFPSRYGTPWGTDYYITAIIMAIFRFIGSGGFAEVIVHDTKTDKFVIRW